MDYRKLKNAAPAKLVKAGEAWKSLLDEFDKVISDFRAQLCDQLDNGDFWRGEAKELATAHGKRIHKRMREYRDRIAPVSKALNTAAEEITTCQRQVRGVADEVNGRDREGWSFDSDGEITYPEGQRSEYESYVAEVEGILSRAAEADREADREAARALSEADDTLEYLNEVLTEERREEEQAAKEAAELASQPPDELSFAEGERLARLLRENGKDPAFAGEFLERVQPKQLLELTEHLQSDLLGDWAANSQGNRLELIGSLQRRLGETLATGTGEEGREYLGEDLHGPEEEDSTDQRAANYGKRMLKAAENWNPGPLWFGDEEAGHRALGMLLHSGEYSSGFLNPVGDGLVEADKKHSFGPLHSEDRNHVDDRGRGGDPLVGLMTALEHSPDTAGSFFDPARDDENLGHLVQRDWPVDRYDHAEGPRHDSSTTEQEENLGHNLLGKALESATLGEQHGSAEAARTVSGMVHTLANTDDSMQDPGKGTIPPPLRDNVGHMLSNYMGAVHEAGDGDPASNSSGSLHLGEENADWARGEAGYMNPRFSQSEVYKVMGSAAYDPNTYAEMRDANMAYTGLKLEAIADSEGGSLEDRRSDMKKEANQASAVFGALDEARSYAVDEFYDGKDAAFNAKIEAGGNLASWGLIGSGAMKSVTETATNLLASGSSVALADGATAVMDQLRQDSSNIVTRETADIQEEGKRDANNLLNQALWNNRMWREETPPPPELLPTEPEPGGPPGRITDSDGQPLNTHQEWVNRKDPYNLGRQTVQNTYHTGADTYADATGNRPVRVSETE
ncbi:hypothetical protein [Actinopolyspora halophila]|uniref:hypothetical protein n=1 Tax=Actinopolyspora halophila TaxID=1850 RepID=UPI00036CE382|nr:hypothetical protein [Actinopolyspora halophila]